MTSPSKHRSHRFGLAGIGLTGALALAGCGGNGVVNLNRKPDFIPGALTEKSYDGASDDLLTAGLGKTGLGGAAPAYAAPAAPTAAELRRNAIYNNYRALLDYTAAGGYGLLYGPNIDKDGNVTASEGRIAGTETIAYADDGSGRQNVTLMVQVPASFDKANACIVTATSSGSRGIYGAIGTAGEWGLKRGCAVAYADKGSGNGFHDLASDAVTRQDGTVDTAANAGASALFRANLTAGERSAFNAQFPDRVAYKHAHSEQNPEKDWGRDTLRAVKLAFYVLNQKYGDVVDGQPGQRSVVLKPDNTLVIASSVSNGGGAALAAAEQDSDGLIDGVAVTEPQVQPNSTAGLVIRQGTATVSTQGKPLADYFTFATVYQPCAALSAQAGLSLAAAFWPAAYTTAAENRCAGLKAKGLLLGATLAAQADEALQKMQQYGWQAESNFLQQSHFRFATNSIAVTYVNAHGRFKPTENVCGFSFANTNAAGDVVPQVAATQAGLFASGNGIPPTSGVNVVYNDSPGGAKLDFLSASPSTGAADFGLDGALCLRSLVTGKDAVTGASLSGTQKAQSDRVIAGIQEVLLSAKLRGKPVIVVAGRSDTLIPVNHAARAYVGRHLSQEASSGSKLRYYEVTNAQHFDTFIAFGALLGYDTRFVPLHRYFNQAMDLMYAHLKTGAALPASQVVHTTPRASVAGVAAPITAANVPPISAAPAAADQIGFSGNTLSVPD
jgi:hydroxybutyrate-dimer hydrolase